MGLRELNIFVNLFQVDGVIRYIKQEIAANGFIDTQDLIQAISSKESAKLQDGNQGEKIKAQAKSFCIEVFEFLANLPSEQVKYNGLSFIASIKKRKGNYIPIVAIEAMSIALPWFDINYQTVGDKVSLLMLACASWKSEAGDIAKLVDLGADINAMSLYSGKPIHFISHEDQDINNKLKLMIELGADPFGRVDFIPYAKMPNIREQGFPVERAADKEKFKNYYDYLKPYAEYQSANGIVSSFKDYVKMVDFMDALRKHKVAVNSVKNDLIVANRELLQL